MLHLKGGRKVHKQSMLYEKKKKKIYPAMALGNDCSQHCGGGIIQIFQMLLLR